MVGCALRLGCRLLPLGVAGTRAIQASRPIAHREAPSDNRGRVPPAGHARTAGTLPGFARSSCAFFRLAPDCRAEPEHAPLLGQRQGRGDPGWHAGHRSVGDRDSAVHSRDRARGQRLSGYGRRQPSPGHCDRMGVVRIRFPVSQSSVGALSGCLRRPTRTPPGRCGNACATTRWRRSPNSAGCVQQGFAWTSISNRSACS